MKSILSIFIAFFAITTTLQSTAGDLGKIGDKIKKAAKKAKENKVVKKIAKDKLNKAESFTGTGTFEVNRKKNVKRYRRANANVRDACFDRACAVAEDSALLQCEEKFGSDNCELDGECRELEYSEGKRRIYCEASQLARGDRGIIED